MMKVWKVRHIPSQLFLCPNKQVKVEGKYVKTNLSKKGKIYTKCPTKKMIVSSYQSIYTHLGDCKSIPLNESDIEIIEID